MFKNKNKENKTYTYLLSYGFTQEVSLDDINWKGTQGGTGRTILNLTKKIKTQNDIIEVENILKNEVEVDNLLQISLYSFSLLGD